MGDSRAIFREYVKLLGGLDLDIVYIHSQNYGLNTSLMLFERGDLVLAAGWSALAVL